MSDLSKKAAIYFKGNSKSEIFAVEDGNFFWSKSTAMSYANSAKMTVTKITRDQAFNSVEKSVTSSSDESLEETKEVPKKKNRKRNNNK